MGCAIIADRSHYINRFLNVIQIVCAIQLCTDSEVGGQFSILFGHIDWTGIS